MQVFIENVVKATVEMSSSCVRWRIEVSGLSAIFSCIAAMFVSERQIRARVMCFTSTPKPVHSNFSNILFEVVGFRTLVLPKLVHTLQKVGTKLS